MVRSAADTPLPEGWHTVSLHDIAEIVMGQSPPGSTVFDMPVGITPNSRTPFVQGNAEFGDTTPDPQKWCSKPPRTARPGDFLISVRAPVGDTNRADQVLGIGRGLAAIRFHDGARAYGWHALNEAKKGLRRMAQGSTFLAVGRNELRSLRIPLPPQLERRAIAEILDAIDATIEQADRVIGATESVRDALLHELLTKGLPGWHTEWQDHPTLGTIPANWRIAGLGQIASIRKQQVQPEAHDETPYVGLEHIRSRGSLLGYGRAGNTRSAKTVFKTGDTLFGKLRPNLRKVARPGFDGVCSTDILALCPSRRVNGRYLLGLMSSERIHRLAVRSCAGTRMPRTSWSFLRGVKIAIPDISEQAYVAEVLAGVDKAVERMGREKAVLAAFKESISDALLTGRVRVPMSR